MRENWYECIMEVTTKTFMPQKNIIKTNQVPVQRLLFQFRVSAD